MDKSLNRHKLPKLTEEEIDHLNSPLSIKEIEFLIKIIDTTKPSVPDGLTGDFSHPLKSK